MPNSNNEKLERKLGSLQAWVSGGLAFIVVFSITVTGLMFWQAYRLGQQAAEVKQVAVTTHDALCAFKLDLQRRYNDNRKLLRDHPEDPVRAFGLEIPRATLESSVANQKATLEALSIVRCV